MEKKVDCSNEKTPALELSNKSSSQVCIKEETGTLLPQTKDEAKWSEYMAARSSAATPDVAFTHVEKSLLSGIQPGQLLEIICERKLPTWYISDVDLYNTSCNVSKSDHQSGISSSKLHLCPTTNNEKNSSAGNNPESHKTLMTYWIAKVVSACGPLLSIEYVLPHTNASEHSWILIGSDTVAGVGHGEKEGYMPAPPLDVITSLSCYELKDADDSVCNINTSRSENYQAVVKLLSFLATSASEYPWVAESALQKETLPSCKRLKPGGYVEVLACAPGKFGWPASIEQNVGGRLQLKFVKLDLPAQQTAAVKSECSGEEIKQEMTGVNPSEHKFWLFCTDHRLRNLGWIDKRTDDGYRYVCPLSGRCLVRLPEAFNSNFQGKNLLLVPLILPLSCAEDESEESSNDYENKCINAHHEQTTEMSTKHCIDGTSNLAENNTDIRLPAKKQKLADVHEGIDKLCSASKNNDFVGSKTDSAISLTGSVAIVRTTLQDSHEDISNEFHGETLNCDNACLQSESADLSGTSEFVKRLAIEKNSVKSAGDADMRSATDNNKASEAFISHVFNSSKECDEKQVQISSAPSLSFEIEEPDLKYLENRISNTLADATKTTVLGKNINCEEETCNVDNLAGLNTNHSDDVTAEKNHTEEISAASLQEKNQMEFHQMKELDNAGCLEQKSSKTERLETSEEGLSVNQLPLLQPTSNNDHIGKKYGKEFENTLLTSYLNEGVCSDEKETKDQTLTKTTELTLDKEAIVQSTKVVLNRPQNQNEIEEYRQSTSEHEAGSEIKTPSVAACENSEEMCSKNAESSLEKVPGFSKPDIASCRTDVSARKNSDISDKIYDENNPKVTCKEKIFDCIKELDSKKMIESSKTNALDQEIERSTKTLDFDDDKNVCSRKILQHGLNTTEESGSMKDNEVLNTIKDVYSHALQLSNANLVLEVKNIPNINDELLTDEKIENVEKFETESSQRKKINFEENVDVKHESARLNIIDATTNLCEARSITKTDNPIENLSPSSMSGKTLESVVDLKTSTSSDGNELCCESMSTTHERAQDQESLENYLSTETKTHMNLKSGMVLEVVNPEKLSCIHAAIVSNVSHDGLIEVMLSSCTEAIVKSEPIHKVDTKELKNEVGKIEDSAYDESRSSCSVSSRSQILCSDASNVNEDKVSTFNSHIMNLQKYSAYFSDLVLLPTGFCDEFGLVLHPLLMDSTITKFNTVHFDSDLQTVADNITSVESVLSQRPSFTCKSEENSFGLNFKVNETMSPKACEVKSEDENVPDSQEGRQSLPISVEMCRSKDCSNLPTETLGMPDNSQNDIKKHCDDSTCVHNIQRIDDIQKTPCKSEENSESPENSIVKEICENIHSDETKVLEENRFQDVSVDFIDIDVEIVDEELQSNSSPIKERTEISSISIDCFSPDKLVDESLDNALVDESDMNQHFCYGNIKNFSWANFFKENPAHERTPLCIFPTFPSAVEAGFCAGQKLEVVHPANPETICAATVAATTGHLLWLKIDSLPVPVSNSVKSEKYGFISSNIPGQNSATNITNVPGLDAPKSKDLHVRHIFCDCKKSNTVVIKPCSSDEIFPVGWAQNNNAKFLFPQPRTSAEIQEIQARKVSSPVICHRDVTKHCLSDPLALSPEPNILCDSRPVASKTSIIDSPEAPVHSRWCPSIYLNHSCCPGPHLSRSKLAAQIGVAVEGSVGSVLGQIVSQSLAAGFCQARLCKDLTSQLQEVSKDRPHWQLIDVKAKSKRFSIRGSVMCPQFRDEVPIFLLRVFEVLQCCPNLWSFTKQPDCPHLCKKAVSNPVSFNVGRVKRSRLDSLLASSSLLANTNLDLDEEMEDEEDEWDAKDSIVPADTGDKMSNDTAADNGNETTKAVRKLRTDTVGVTASTSEGTDAGDQQPFKKRKLNRSYAIPPARVTTDPLLWSVDDVFDYVSHEATISHHATWLRNEKIDGKALMLLNLSTLVNQLQLPHVAVLPLAHHLCRLKMAHLLLRDGASLVA